MGHAYVDELLSEASCSTEQRTNDDRQTRQHQQEDAKKSVKFAKLVREAWEELHSKDVDGLKSFIRPLHDSLVSDDCKEVVQSAKSTREVFDALSNYSRKWNYRDTTLFTIVVEEFCTQDSELVKKLQGYNQELEEEQLPIAGESGKSYHLPYSCTS